MDKQEQYYSQTICFSSFITDTVDFTIQDMKNNSSCIL